MVNPLQEMELPGQYASAVAAALANLDDKKVVARIWQRDHRVWQDDPTEIADRLGWLNVADTMRAEIPQLSRFAAGVAAGGCRHVVLLGMGGSSLGPEVLRRVFGSNPGYPRLLVLDSTLPAWIDAVDQAIDPAHTLFLVSSKSGSTIEPNALYAHFRQRVEAAAGKARAGQRFVAITDPGTVLERMGGGQGFRQVFLNPPDIGGRYSVLSYFGLVPAALLGLNLELLLDRSDAMREWCAQAPARKNPGAYLGALMGSLAQQGRDKLTLVTSPALAGFGLWVEQLLAESLGKEGTGIIPVAGEPLLPPGSYGQDRLFVYLRLSGDDNSAANAAMAAIASQHPVIRLDLADRYDLAAEFFRWELATAVAGHLLGVHPFDQPDVQGAKDMTDRMLEQYRATGQLPSPALPAQPASFQDLLTQAEPGDYLAILAYLPDTPAVVAGLESLRCRIAGKHRIATTAGFGPRYLHSTGQLHKGGPPSGLFLQLTADHPLNPAIPGHLYSFATLANAQADGDLAALQARGRRILRIPLGQRPAAGLSRLATTL